MKLAATAMLAVMSPMSAGASASWFTVEIIVFEHLHEEALQSEHWPVSSGEPSLQGAVELTRPHAGEPGGVAHAFRLLNRSELALNGVRDSLRRSERYRPLLHAGWRLPGLSRSAARPAHVSERLVDGGTYAAQADGGERASVHGTVKVSRARFLQVDMDLLYSRPVTGETDPPETLPARFRLVSERRMRSGELHYIDHPLFGVLVLIRPFQAAAEGASEA